MLFERGLGSQLTKFQTFLYNLLHLIVLCLDKNELTIIKIYFIWLNLHNILFYNSSFHNFKSLETNKRVVKYSTIRKF
jgi:hypothetical protein